MRVVVESLLEDEIDHGRLGWALLASACAEGWGQGPVRDALPALVERAVADVIDAPGRGTEDPELQAHGYLSPAAGAAIYRQTLGEVTLVLLGQDLLCVPDELFGLAGICAIFQQRNPRVFEHIRDRVGALRGVRFDEVAALGVGEALLASTHGTTQDFCQGARRVRIRPPLCHHGGFTRAVV